MKIYKLILFAIVVSLSFSCENDRKENATDNETSETENIDENSLDDPDDEIDDYVPFEFAFVSSNKYIVLESDFDGNLASGNAYEPIGYGDQHYSAAKDIDENQIPDGYSELIGKRVQVGTETGKIVIAEIKSLKIVAECIPHFGSIQMWEDTFDEGIDMTDEEIADEIWGMGEYYLVAEFETEKQVSDEIIFAMQLDAKPEIFPEIKSDEIEQYEAKIIESLTSTKIFKNYQSEYEELEYTEAEKWWEYNDELYAMPANIPVNDEKYIAMYLVAGNPCGGDFFFKTFSVTKFREDGLLENVYLTEKGYYLVLALDINYDGVLEYIVSDFFGHKALLYFGEPDWEERYEWNVPFLDCPC